MEWHQLKEVIGKTQIFPMTFFSGTERPGKGGFIAV